MDTESYNATGTAPPPAELRNVLDRLLDEVEGGAETEASPPPTAPTSAQPEPSPPGGGANVLGSLLANPALLTALPTIAENLAPLLGGLAGGTGSAPTATRPHTIDRHTALLCAVKPYLSPHRREAAETVIRLCRVWDALERSGISLSGLLAGISSATPSVRDTATATATATEREVT